MIPVDSLLYKIDQKLNKLSTNIHQQINLEDKILALNEAQIKLIKQKVDGFSVISGMGLDAFKKRYDKFNISRKVLSRSIEDYGTMIESIIPWHATSLFMVATLGVSFGDYWHWQLLSLVNIIIAPLIVILGIGCFYKNKKKKDE